MHELAREVLLESLNRKAQHESDLVAEEVSESYFTELVHELAREFFLENVDPACAQFIDAARRLDPLGPETESVLSCSPSAPVKCWLRQAPGRNGLSHGALKWTWLDVHECRSKLKWSLYFVSIV